MYDFLNSEYEMRFFRSVNYLDRYAFKEKIVTHLIEVNVLDLVDPDRQLSVRPPREVLQDTH